MVKIGDRINGVVDGGDVESGPDEPYRVPGVVTRIEDDKVFWIRDDTDEETWNHRGLIRKEEPTRYSIAVYELDQAFGGREEGGWWYTTGTLVRVLRVNIRNQERAYRICRRINSLLHYRFERSGKRPLSSVAYAGGYLAAEICEGNAPEHFPDQRPFYE